MAKEQRRRGECLKAWMVSELNEQAGRAMVKVIVRWNTRHILELLNSGCQKGIRPHWKEHQEHSLQGRP